MIRDLLLTVFSIIILLFLLGTFYFSQPSVEPLLQAQKSYDEAIKASTIAEREHYLNETLSTYLSLEEKDHPNYGNGKFYSNLGETFFQLEQYPWAALYFYQAQSLLPRDEKISEKLHQVLAKLNIPSSSDESVFKKVFFFHYSLSLPERMLILVTMTLTLFALTSIYLWKNYRFLKSLLLAFLLGWVLIFSSVMYTKYFEPLEGVIVKAVLLYPSANMQTSIVTAKPLMEGSKVEILDLVGAEEWFKIRTKNGEIGFIPSHSLRLIAG